MRSVFASAADSAYGFHLVNLISSVRANSDIFDAIVVYDLGLSAPQRDLLERLPGVDVRRMPAFSPHWNQGFTWKPWIWTQLEADAVFYLDAGATVVRSLTPAMQQVAQLGYFLVEQGERLGDIVPTDYFALYELDAQAAQRPYVAAGILAFRTDGAFWDSVVVPTYEDCLAGRSLGFSADDAVRRNHGLAQEASPEIRDCPTFRWDQTILNIHLAKRMPDAVVADIEEYAGVRSPHVHPRQVIWAHRRRGDLRYLKRAPYTGPGAWRARAFGLWLQLRWWKKLREDYFHLATYRWKLRKMRASLGRRRADAGTP